MSTLIDRLNEFVIPDGSFLPPSKERVASFIEGKHYGSPMPDGDLLLLSLATAYLLQYRCGLPKETAFKTAIDAAASLDRKDLALDLLSKIGSYEQEVSLSSAISLAHYGLYQRAGKSIFDDLDAIPSKEQIDLLRAMIADSLSFFEKEGGIVAASKSLSLGFGRNVDSIEGTTFFITPVGLWTVHAFVGKASKIETAELAVLYRMYLRASPVEAARIKELGIFNPLDCVSHRWDPSAISSSFVKDIDEGLIGYGNGSTFISPDKPKLTSDNDKAHFSILANTPPSYSYLEYHTDATIKASSGKHTIYWTSFSLFKGLTIDNHTDEEFQRVIVSFSFSSEMFSCNDIYIDDLKPLEKRKIEPSIDLRIDEKALYNLNGTLNLTIVIEARDAHDRKLLGKNIRTVTVLPLEQPSDDRGTAIRLLSKYVVTNFPDLSKLHQSAIAKNGGKDLIAYQNQGRDAILREADAIFRAVHDWGINYANPPASVRKFQNIRLPNQVLRERLGTCIDLAILFCSALLQVGFHPILVIIGGHAFAGFFLSEFDSFSQSPCLSPSEVSNAANGPRKKAVLFECTLAIASSSSSFRQAVERANDILRGYRGDFAAIDVFSSQANGCAAIPIPRENGDIDFEIKPAPIEDKELLKLVDYDANILEAKPDESRFDVWKRSLLDLSLANRLVNFHFLKSKLNYAWLPNPEVEKIFEFLKKGSGECTLIASGDSSFEGTPYPWEDQGMNSPVLHDRLEMAMKDGKLYAVSSPKAMAKIMAVDRSNREETGSPTLFLALGLLSINVERKEAFGPFLLVPIVLKKERTVDSYRLEYDFDRLMVNETFLEFVRSRQGVDYRNLYDIDSSTPYRDIVASLLSKGQGTLSYIENVSFIANFSYAHYVMWRDMEDREAELREHPVVQSLLENRSLVAKNDDLNDIPVDELDDMSQFAAPLPYDSTQLKAIIRCGRGDSFVLDGPPGTGKSQTIVNMIVNAIYKGKSVLFVAEKQAALEVVRERLSRLRFNNKNYGLDSFALQLYSNKVNRKDFFLQLEKTMALPVFDEPGKISSKAAEIEERRKELAAELSSFHDAKGCFYSLYDALSRQLDCKVKNIPYSFPADLVSSYDEAVDRKAREAVEELSSLLKQIPDYASSPTRLFHFESFNPALASGIRNDIVSLSSSFSKLSEAWAAAISPLHGTIDGHYSTLKSDLELLSAFSSDDIVKKAFDDLPLLEDEDSFEAFMKDIATFHEVEEELDGSYQRDGRDRFPLERVEAELEASKGFFARILKGKEPLKTVLPFAKPGTKVNRKFIVSTLDLWKKRAEILRKNASYCEKARNLFAIDPLEREARLDLLSKRYEATRKACLAANLSDRSLAMTSEFLSLDGLRVAAFKRNLSAFKNRYDEFDRIFGDLANKYGFVLSEFDDGDGLKKVIGWLVGFFEKPSSVELLYPVAQANAVGRKLATIGLAGFFEFARNGIVPPFELAEAYEWALDQAFINRHFEIDAYPPSFNASEYGRKIADYRSKIDEYRSLSIAATVARLSSSFLNMDSQYSDANPIGQLKKLIHNGGRGTSIRKAMSRYGNYIRKYFPCFLMSPLAAAQYLSIEQDKFDIVIFDEGSQVPTAEGIGPLARGKALIVAGDPQQMPPSNYFSSTVNSDEYTDASLVDSESLLDDCLSIDFPRVPLSFHYRSHHESLIAFSNQWFYQSGLYTFPAPDERTTHVKLQYVETAIDKKTNALTGKETEAIVALLRSLLENPNYLSKSIGIIVFNSTQQEKLTNEVEKFFEKRPLLAERAHWNEEDDERRLFIKNLESVQGDERDVIILSVNFGKGKNGKAIVNGPLTRARGERRLNVAASRSKEEMYVLTTIKSSEIETGGRVNDGASYLKRFLAYCEGLASPIKKPNSEAEPSPLALSIGKEIEKKGYFVAYGLGESDFKLDIAVAKSKNDPFALGIMLDEAPLSRNVSVRDRFYVEPMMLEGLHWKLIRVYGLEFVTTRRAAIERILTAVDRAFEGSPEEANDEKPSDVISAPTLVKRRSEFEEAMVPFVPYRLTVHGSYDSILRGQIYYDRHLAGVLYDLIAQEGPVSIERIRTVVKDYFGISRCGNRVNELIYRCLGRMGDVSIETQDYAGMTFYWPKAKDPSSWRKINFFRVGGRSVLDICKEELALLMALIAKEKTIIDRDDIEKETMSYLETKKLTQRAKGKLDYVVDYAVKAGILGSSFVEKYPD